MKILIIQTAFIGDVVLATALVEKLHQHYPEARIDFVLRKGNEALLESHPIIEKLYVFDKMGGKYRKLLSLIKQFRSENYDHVINAQRFATTGIMTAFSGGKETIGFDKNPMSFLFSRSIKHMIGEGHETNRNQGLIAHLTDSESCKPRLYPSKADFDNTARSKPYVCMAPASVWFTKQYPEERWVQLIDQIPSEFDVILLGGPGDKQHCDRIKKQCRRHGIENSAGAYSFLESAAMMSRAKMNYVNDSAPLHFASAMNAPVTAIFCSTLPSFGFGPLSDNSIVVESNERLKCRPCGLHGKSECPEGHFKCAAIEAQAVLDGSGF